MSWSTSDELMFLRGIGTWSGQGSVPTDEQQIDLLKKYRLSCERRANWGSVDRFEVFKEVDRLLAELEGKKKEDKT